VQALLDTGLDAAARDDLRVYSRAVVQSPAHPTIKLVAVSDVGKARVYGQALRKLEVMPGGVTIKKIFNQPEALDRLLAFGAVDSFVGYCAVKRPTLEAEDDAKSSPEITSYLAFHGAADEGFIGALPEVRNLHRFEHAALQRLAANLAIPPDKIVSNAQPLVLLLHSTFDHNGAFHRDPNMTTVITQSDKLVLLVEGKDTLDEMRGELAGIAARYGHDGKIHEVMLAGHGNASSIQMAGTMDAQGKEVNQEVATGHDAASDAFFAELVKNMASGGESRIVLNACLTASNAVGPTTANPSGVLPNDPDAAAKEVQNAIKTNPSLKDYIAAAAGKGVQVRGSNASFGQVGLLDASGHLDVVSAPDPKLTAPKADYAREGNEPQGVMRALVEVWAADRVAMPHTTVARDIVTNRAKDKSTSWQPRIIAGLCRAIDRKYDDGELMRRLAEGAGALSELGEDKSPDGLGWIPGAAADAIYSDVAGADEWKSQPKLPLLVYQHWLKVTAAQGANFKTHLATNFTCATAREFVKIPFIAASMAALLPAGTPTPARGDLELALLGVLEEKVPDPQAKRFLLEVAGTNSHFDAGLGVEALLDNASQESTIEAIIGLKGTAPAAAATAALPANTDLDGDGTPDVYIEAMDRKTAHTTTRAHLRSRPVAHGHHVATTRPHGRLIVVGKSGDFYVVEHGTTPRFVLQTDVALGEKPNVDPDGDGVNDFYVESITRRAAVTATHLNVRQYPGMDERVMASLAKGADVVVDGTSGDWFAIEHSGHTRFVHKDWVQFKDVP
jgi:hypothetical protein